LVAASACLLPKKTYVEVLMDKANLSNGIGDIQVSEHILVVMTADEIKRLKEISDRFFGGLGFDDSLIFDKMVDSYILGIEKNKTIKIIVS
jgi:hypothetical protein